MEPTLREGDYVLVRKCEFGALLDVLWSLLPFVGGGDGGGDSIDIDNDNIMSNPRTRERSQQQQQQQQRTVDAMDRARLVKHEMMAGAVVANAPVARLYDTPPAALPGHVVIYKHPLAYCPRTLSVKRVIAVGGQLLQLPTGTEEISASATSSRRRNTTTAVVPPYFLHVEGTGAGREFVEELILVFFVLPELTPVAVTCVLLQATILPTAWTADNWGPSAKACWSVWSRRWCGRPRRGGDASRGGRRMLRRLQVVLPPPQGERSGSGGPDRRSPM
jgi:hypothetical protein